MPIAFGSPLYSADSNKNEKEAEQIRREQLNMFGQKSEPNEAQLALNQPQQATLCHVHKKLDQIKSNSLGAAQIVATASADRQDESENRSPNTQAEHLEVRSQQSHFQNVTLVKELADNKSPEHSLNPTNQQRSRSRGKYGEDVSKVNTPNVTAQILKSLKPGYGFLPNYHKPNNQSARMKSSKFFQTNFPKKESNLNQISPSQSNSQRRRTVQRQSKEIRHQRQQQLANLGKKMQKAAKILNSENQRSSRRSLSEARDLASYLGEKKCSVGLQNQIDMTMTPNYSVQPSLTRLGQSKEDHLQNQTEKAKNVDIQPFKDSDGSRKVQDFRSKTNDELKPQKLQHTSHTDPIFFKSPSLYEKYARVLPKDTKQKQGSRNQQVESVEIGFREGRTHQGDKEPLNLKIETEIEVIHQKQSDYQFQIFTDHRKPKYKNNKSQKKQSRKIESEQTSLEPKSVQEQPDLSVLGLTPIDKNAKKLEDPNPHNVQEVVDEPNQEANLASNSNRYKKLDDLEKKVYKNKEFPKRQPPKILYFDKKHYNTLQRLQQDSKKDGDLQKSIIQQKVVQNRAQEAKIKCKKEEQSSPKLITKNKIGIKTLQHSIRESKLRDSLSVGTNNLSQKNLRALLLKQGQNVESQQVKESNSRQLINQTQDTRAQQLKTEGNFDLNYFPDTSDQNQNLAANSKSGESGEVGSNLHEVLRPKGIEIYSLSMANSDGMASSPASPPKLQQTAADFRQNLDFLQANRRYIATQQLSVASPNTIVSKKDSTKAVQGTNLVNQFEKDKECHISEVVTANLLSDRTYLNQNSKDTIAQKEGQKTKVERPDIIKVQNEFTENKNLKSMDSLHTSILSEEETKKDQKNEIHSDKGCSNIATMQSQTQERPESPPYAEHRLTSTLTQEQKSKKTNQFGERNQSTVVKNSDLDLNKAYEIQLIKEDETTSMLISKQKKSVFIQNATASLINQKGELGGTLQQKSVELQEIEFLDDIKAVDTSAQVEKDNKFSKRKAQLLKQRTMPASKLGQPIEVEATSQTDFGPLISFQVPVDGQIVDPNLLLLRSPDQMITGFDYRQMQDLSQQINELVILPEKVQEDLLKNGALSTLHESDCKLPVTTRLSDDELGTISERKIALSPHFGDNSVRNSKQQTKYNIELIHNDLVIIGATPQSRMASLKDPSEIVEMPEKEQKTEKLSHDEIELRFYEEGAGKRQSRVIQPENSFYKQARRGQRIICKSIDGRLRILNPRDAEVESNPQQHPLIHLSGIPLIPVTIQDKIDSIPHKRVKSAGKFHRSVKAVQESEMNKYFGKSNPNKKQNTSEGKKVYVVNIDRDQQNQERFVGQEIKVGQIRGGIQSQFPLGDNLLNNQNAIKFMDSIQDSQGSALETRDKIEVNGMQTARDETQSLEKNPDANECSIASQKLDYSRHEDLETVYIQSTMKFVNEGNPNARFVNKSPVGQNQIQNFGMSITQENDPKSLQNINQKPTNASILQKVRKSNFGTPKNMQGEFIQVQSQTGGSGGDHSNQDMMSFADPFKPDQTPVQLGRFKRFSVQNVGSPINMAIPQLSNIIEPKRFDKKDLDQNEQKPFKRNEVQSKKSPSELKVMSNQNSENQSPHNQEYTNETRRHSGISIPQYPTQQVNLNKQQMQRLRATNTSSIRDAGKNSELLSEIQTASNLQVRKARVIQLRDSKNSDIFEDITEQENNSKLILKPPTNNTRRNYAQMQAKTVQQIGVYQNCLDVENINRRDRQISNDNSLDPDRKVIYLMHKSRKIALKRQVKSQRATKSITPTNKKDPQLKSNIQKQKSNKPKQEGPSFFTSLSKTIGDAFKNQDSNKVQNGKLQSSVRENSAVTLFNMIKQRPFTAGRQSHLNENLPFQMKLMIHSKTKLKEVRAPVKQESQNIFEKGKSNEKRPRTTGYQNSPHSEREHKLSSKLLTNAFNIQEEDAEATHFDFSSTGQAATAFQNSLMSKPQTPNVMVRGKKLTETDLFSTARAVQIRQNQRKNQNILSSNQYIKKENQKEQSAINSLNDNQLFAQSQFERRTQAQNKLERIGEQVKVNQFVNRQKLKSAHHRTNLKMANLSQSVRRENELLSERSHANTLAKPESQRSNQFSRQKQWVQTRAPQVNLRNIKSGNPMEGHRVRSRFTKTLTMRQSSNKDLFMSNVISPGSSDQAFSSQQLANSNLGRHTEKRRQKRIERSKWIYARTNQINYQLFQETSDSVSLLKLQPGQINLQIDQ